MAKDDNDPDFDPTIEQQIYDLDKEPVAGDAIAYYSAELAAEKFGFINHLGHPLKEIGGVKATDKVDDIDFRVIRLSVMKGRPVAVIRNLKLVVILDDDYGIYK